MAPPTFVSLTSYHYNKVMHWLGSQLRLFTGSATKILWAIVDKTFGFRKWEDMISLSQFQLITDLTRETIVDTIKDLLTLNFIRRRKSGNSFTYALNIPEGLFVEKSEKFSTSSPQQPSFFTQNSETYSHSEEAMVGNSDTQIKDVTELVGNGWNRVVEILSALTDINATAPRSAYDLRNLPRWAKRAAALGMGWGDVWTLWRACQRVGRNPLALFIHRLMDDGSPPTGKQAKPLTTREQRHRETLLRFRAELE